MKIITAPMQSFSGHAPSFNYSISMDTKSNITDSSRNKSYIHVIVDAFRNFVATLHIKSTNAKTAGKSLSNHWIVKIPSYICCH